MEHSDGLISRKMADNRDIVDPNCAAPTSVIYGLLSTNGEQLYFRSTWPESLGVGGGGGEGEVIVVALKFDNQEVKLFSCGRIAEN